MNRLVDSSVWIDYFRPKTPLAVKASLEIVVQGADVVTCEPILFELLRATSAAEAERLEDFFETVPVLATPPALWREARALGRKCSAAGFLPPSMDLLIARIALGHGAVVVTFDDHFRRIAGVCPLEFRLLPRPMP